MKSIMQKAQEFLEESIKATPPVTVAGLTFMGFTLNDLVLIATLVYVVLQVGFLVYRWRRMHLEDKDAD